MLVSTSPLVVAKHKNLQQRSLLKWFLLSGCERGSVEEKLHFYVC